MEIVRKFLNENIDLALSKELNIESFGIWRGKLSKVLFSCILHEYYPEKVDLIGTAETMEQMVEAIPNIKNVSFTDGLCGIGWAVEWLCQTSFIDENSDEILEEVDNLLYKLSMYQFDESISLTSGTLAKLLYFFKRYEANNNTNRYQRISIQDCIVVLIDNLKDNLFQKEYCFDYDSIEEVSNAMILFAKIYPTRIHFQVVEQVLFYLVESSLDFLQIYQINRGGSVNLHRKLFLLSYAVFFTGNMINLNFWRQTGYEKLSYFINQYRDTVGESKSFWTPEIITLVSLIHKENGGDDLAFVLVEYYRTICFDVFPNELKGGKYQVFLTALDLLNGFKYKWQEALLLM